MNALLRTAVVALVMALLVLGVFGLRLVYFPWREYQEIRLGEEFLQR